MERKKVMKGTRMGHEWRGEKRGTCARNAIPFRQGLEGCVKVALPWPCVFKSQNTPAEAKNQQGTFRSWRKRVVRTHYTH